MFVYQRISILSPQTMRWLVNALVMIGATWDCSGVYVSFTLPVRLSVLNPAEAKAFDSRV